MGATDDGGARACAGVRWVGLCLCSVAITDTSMAGSSHKLLKQKRSNQACLGSVPFKCVFFLPPALALGSLPYRKVVPKQVGLVHIQRSDTLPVLVSVAPLRYLYLLLSSYIGYHRSSARVAC